MGAHVGEVPRHLAEAVKDFVEEAEHVLAARLGEVVHGLAGQVADLAILVGEARQDGRHQRWQVLVAVLPGVSRGHEATTGMGWGEG